MREAQRWPIQLSLARHILRDEPPLENEHTVCQVAVSLSVANGHASLPIASRLYLPREWADDPVRCTEAGVPDEVVFQTKPQIALAQLRAARAAGIGAEVALLDAGYGNDTDLRDGITELGLPYIVGIQSSTSLWPPDVQPLPPKSWSGRGRPTSAEHQPISAKQLTKSPRHLAVALKRLGHEASHTLVGELLQAEKFSLQGNRKTREGGLHPDRDAQFAYINASVTAALAEQQPVISVDTKKKELIGDFRNAGREWRPQGQPEEVRVHDFLIKELGRAVPYGIYDLAANAGWVSVGINHDTAEFAVQTIRRWWHEVGRLRYPEVRCLTVTADGGGSNGSRARLWKRELQRLANELGIEIKVHHLPPGTSKWNKIEHRLFSFISMNWRARPLVSYRVIVDLISATTTETGLTVRCELDPAPYATGVVVSDAEMAAINLVRDAFHGEWNYTIKPRNSLRSDGAVFPGGP